MKKIIVIALTAGMFLLSGCDKISPEPVEYTIPEEEPGEREVTKSSLDEMADEEHEPYTLDDNYLYLHGYNPSSFKAQAANVVAGMSAAQYDYYIAEAKYSLWSDIIANIDMEGMEEEFYTNADTLFDLVEAIAEAKKLSLADYAAQYAMSEEDLTTFLTQMSEELSYDATEYELLAELETELAAAQNAMSEEEMAKYKEVTGGMIFSFDTDALKNQIALFNGTDGEESTDISSVSEDSVKAETEWATGQNDQLPTSEDSEVALISKEEE